MITPTVKPLITNGDGAWQRADGSFVPERIIKPIDRERDSFVREIVGRALPLSGLLEEFRRTALGDVAAFRQLSAEQYGVKLRGTEGNVELATFDGAYKIKIANNKTMMFDERLNTAKVVIDKCLHRFVAGGGDEIKAIINDAFRVDGAGAVSYDRIAALTRLDISDEEWQTAMKLVRESMQVQSSKAYIRLYQRDELTGEYQQIPLDCSKFGGEGA